MGSMEVHGRSGGCSSGAQSEEEMDLRRGPWTMEEDLVLVNYINRHGEGRWNSLARCAGLKRTGKSCRLRWLNYLRPDVRRGNITLEEQLLILELHSRWGNRWSKIAQHLPGRTDNEIKNYWRTRVQKHAKQLRCDVNSKQFKDAMRYLWMPRLVERIRAAAAATASTSGDAHVSDVDRLQHQRLASQSLPYSACGYGAAPEQSCTDSIVTVAGAQAVSPASEFADNCFGLGVCGADFQAGPVNSCLDYPLPASNLSSGDAGIPFSHGFELQNGWFGGDASDNTCAWSEEDIWLLQQTIS